MTFPPNKLVLLFRTFRSPNSVRLDWEVPVDFFNSSNPIIGFNVYYTESPNNTFSKINDEVVCPGEIADGYITGSFKHIGEFYNKFVRGYYKIEALHDLKYPITHYESDISLSDMLDIYGTRDVYSEVMLERDMFGLMSSVDPLTIPAALFLKKTTGILCSRCGVSKKIGNAQGKCFECLGTGFTGGYYLPVLGYIDHVSNLEMQQSLENVGRSQEYSTTIRTSSAFALLRPDDYIRELTPPNRLFCIGSAADTEFITRPLTYFLPCKLEYSEHPLWQIDVPNTKELLDPKVWFNTIKEDYARLNNKFKEQFLEIRKNSTYQIG
jgi:hypothetical protein